MAVTEAVPFAKSGGLADMVPALSAALIKKGHEVIIFMPLYGFIDKSRIEPLKQWQEQIFSTHYNNIQYLFWDSSNFSYRNELYNEEGIDYEDNIKAFSSFSKIVLEYCNTTNDFDIIHIHDWMLGTLPIYKKTKYPELTAKTIITIHNIGYQGIFHIKELPILGIDEGEAFYYGLIKDDMINFLHAGISTSDYITTVSPTYAEEILEEEYSFGLGKTIRSRNHRLFGILNGIDIDNWNPSTDPLIEYTFTEESLNRKEKNKLALQKELNLSIDSSKILVGSIGRLVHQKGIEPLVEDNGKLFTRILNSFVDLQFVILGSGITEWENVLTNLSHKHHNLSVINDFDNALAHRIEASADVFFMPSLYEPCGLNQMYSMRYGTIPLASRTGGLCDTIVDVYEDKENATGVLFNSDSDYYSVFQNVKETLFDNKPLMFDIRLRAMKIDFSWIKSAQEYERLYIKAKSR